jgi:hypothetical protein
MSALQNENGEPGKIRGGAKHQMDLNCRCMKRKFLARIRSFYEHAQASCRRLAGTDPGEPTPFCRWWPALMAGGGVAFCALILALQQMELRELKEDIQALHATLSGQNNAAKTELFGNGRFGQAANASPKAYEQEIERLKEQAAILRADLAQMEKLHLENVALRDQLAVPVPVPLDAEAQAREAAQQAVMKIECLRHLELISLAVRRWMDDRDGEWLPANFVPISDDLGGPAILICPRDSSRQPAQSWASFSSRNSSYQFLSSLGQTPDRRVGWRCGIHGHIGLSDGSVHHYGSNPGLLLQRDGKLYLR